MRIEQIIISALIGYFFGCIQTAYLIGRVFKKIDIRKHGSSNAGASNVTQVMGWRYGVITAVVDILKGTAAVLLIGALYPKSPTLLFIAGASVILGHIFPIILGFKGGKGTASLIGIMLGINFKIALIIAIVLIVITILTDYIALGSIAMFTIVPISTYLMRYELLCTIIGVVLLIICLYKHTINIKRILAGTEMGLRATAKKKQASM